MMSERYFGETFWIEGKQWRGKHFLVTGVSDSKHTIDVDVGLREQAQPREVYAVDSNRNQYNLTELGERWVVSQPNSQIEVFIDNNEIHWGSDDE